MMQGVDKKTGGFGRSSLHPPVPFLSPFLFFSPLTPPTTRTAQPRLCTRAPRRTARRRRFRLRGISFLRSGNTCGTTLRFRRLRAGTMRWLPTAASEYVLRFLQSFIQFRPGLVQAFRFSIPGPVKRSTLNVYVPSSKNADAPTDGP